MSALEAAREELRQALATADRRDDWPVARLLDGLHDVADMVCRVGDHWASTHYQADKAGDMVLAALRVRRAAFWRHSPTFWTSDDGPDLVGDATDLALEVERCVGGLLWAVAAGERPWESQVQATVSAVRELGRWVEALPWDPDPVDE